MKNFFHFLFYVLFINTGFSQKIEVEYSPVNNTSVEESFPHAAAILVSSFEVYIDKFDYSNKILKSSWFKYNRGLLGLYRCKFLFEINEKNDLNVSTVDIEYKNSNDIWESSGEGLFSKKEEKFRALINEAIRRGIEVDTIHQVNQEWFFRDLTINSLFFADATDLAVERWYNQYLEDKLIGWNMVFKDIEKNDLNTEYKYKETYSHIIENPLVEDESKENFHVIRFTNRDENVLSKKGEKLLLKGYCRSLIYEDGLFKVIVTESLEDNVPSLTKGTTLEKQNSKTSNSILEVADQLKKLKELLDLGAITEEEYQNEKSKLIN